MPESSAGEQGATFSRLRSHCIRPLALGVIFAPAIIVAHEAGHYLAAHLLGLEPKLHYASVMFHGPAEVIARFRVLATAAGPAVELMLAATGLIWLLRGRAGRRHSEPTLSDWLATSLALAAGRWLRCLTGTPSHPQPEDEAFLSQAAGLPAWVIPYGLAPLGLAVVVAVIRLHPSGLRLGPFASWFIGGLAGLSLWLHVLGPVLLPRP